MTVRILDRIFKRFRIGIGINTKAPEAESHLELSFSTWRLRILKQILPVNLVFGRRTFNLFQSLGVHLTPVHFYQPIPDTRKLDERLWSEDSELAGISIDPEKQLRRLKAFSNQFRSEYEKFPYEKADEASFFHNQDAFKSIDAEMLYCTVREYKP